MVSLKHVTFALVISLLALIAGSAKAFAANPDGLYLMTRMNMMGGSLEIQSWYFKGGQVTNRPMGNIANFDFRAASAARPDQTGTYSISGNKMTIKWANGKTSEGTYEPKDKGCFYFDMGLFCPATPFTSSTIDGTFTGGASAGYGSVASATTITFSKNGQYTQGSAGSVTGRTAQSTVSAGATGSESGTYQISGVVMTLNPSGGKSRQVVAFPYDDGTNGPKPRRIVYEGIVLKRL